MSQYSTALPVYESMVVGQGYLKGIKDAFTLSSQQQYKHQLLGGSAQPGYSSGLNSGGWLKRTLGQLWRADLS